MLLRSKINLGLALSLLSLILPFVIASLSLSEAALVSGAVITIDPFASLTCPSGRASILLTLLFPVPVLTITLAFSEAALIYKLFPAPFGIPVTSVSMELQYMFGSLCKFAPSVPDVLVENVNTAPLFCLPGVPIWTPPEMVPPVSL